MPGRRRGRSPGRQFNRGGGSATSPERRQAASNQAFTRSSVNVSSAFDSRATHSAPRGDTDVSGVRSSGDDDLRTEAETEPWAFPNGEDDAAADELDHRSGLTAPDPFQLVRQPIDCRNLSFCHGA